MAPLRGTVGIHQEGYLLMKDFTTYLSTAPVVAALWFGCLAGLLIEVNRFYPDGLAFSL